jgi:hypothetical protein
VKQETGKLPSRPEVDESIAAQELLNKIATGHRYNLDTSPKEKTMRLAFAIMLLPLALAGCLSFSSSNPSPPASNTTVVTPER